MSYGTIKVDTITFTDGGVDKSVSVSGLTQNPTITGNLTVTGTISGDLIQGQTVSGATITGGNGQFTTITGTTVNAGTVNAVSGVFTNISGSTVVLTSGVFASGTAAAPSVSIGATDNGLYSPGTDQVAISTSGTGRLFVDSNGKVGIGVSPSYHLHVNAGTTDTVASFNSSDANAWIQIRDNTTTDTAVMVGAIGDDLRLRAGSNERLRITSTGELKHIGGGSEGSPSVYFSGTAPSNSLFVEATTGRVGLGTSTPDGKLDVTGTGNASGGVVVINDAGTIGLEVVSVDPTILFNETDTTDKNYQIRLSAGDLLFQTQTDARTGASTKVTIDSLGRAGIGITTPGSVLEAKGLSAGAAVGTFTSNETGSDTPLVVFQRNGGAVAGAINYKATTSPLRLEIGTTTNHRFSIFTNNTQAITVNTSQQVEIGTGSFPGLGKLQVAGANATTSIGGAECVTLVDGDADNEFNILNFATSAGGTIARIGAKATTTGAYPSSVGELHFAVQNGASTNTAMVIDATGKVGIGNTSPSSSLTVGSAATANPIADVSINSSVVDRYRLKLTSSAFNADTKWLGLGFGYHDNYLKAGILAEAKDNNARANLHFCLDGNANSDNAGLADSKMVITYGGNVGVGTTSPGALLDVSASAPELRISSSNAAQTSGSSVGKLSFYTPDGTTPGGAGVAAFLETTSSTANGSDYQLLISKREGSGGGSCFINLGASATGAISFGTNTSGAGTERVRIDSSGRLLVGTSTESSNNLLVVEGNTTSDTGGAIAALKRGTDVSGMSTNDYLGILRFTSRDSHVFADISAQCDATPGASDYPGRLVFSTTADSASSPTERVRITSTGVLFCGYDSRDATLESTDQLKIGGNGYTAFHALNGTAYTIGQNSNSRALRIGSGSGWATTGVSLAAGGTSWGTYSDERLKQDIVELDGCLDQLSGIRCVTYRLKDVDEADSKKRIGVIAQDLEGKFDEALNASRRTEDDVNEYLSVQYADLVPVLIKSLQEAKGRIETLEAEVAALKGA